MIMPEPEPEPNPDPDPTLPEHASKPEGRRPSVVARATRRCLRVFRLIVVGCVVIGITAWGTLAICYAGLPGTNPRYVAAAVFAAASVAVLLWFRPRRYRLLAFGAMFVLALAWFFTRTPSNDRDWATDVSELAWAQIEGDNVTVHNVRNFDYRSASDYAPRWEHRTYDLSKLATVDYILVYWGSPAIAHSIVSFGFADGQYLSVSIETRKERWESYSALQGFFRQYELVYVFADERDVLRLRTNHRGEDVYLYRTRITPERGRGILLSYLGRANSLRREPEFYNALTTNCATSILPHARAGGAPARFSWEVLLNGYSARQAHRNGLVDDSIPYEELRTRSYINPTAKDLDRDLEFSRKIRAGLPDPFKPRGPAGGR